MNVVVLRGTVSRDSALRHLAGAAVVMELDLSTTTGSASASVPVSWPDPAPSAAFVAGTEVVVVGHVRRRFYRAAGATQSRTEVVAHSVVAATQRRRVASLLAGAVARIGGG